MTDYSTYDDAFSDPYAEDYGVAGYSPEQLMMMQQILGEGPQSYESQFGMNPQMQMMFGGMAMPQMDTKGRVQPFDLGVQTQLTNFGQDIGSSIGNNMMAYMSGPGAYAPGALDPVYDEKPLAATQQYQLQAMAQSGGIQGTIASLIMGGMNAGKATARVRAMLKNPEKFPDVITPAEAADMRSELDTIPADPMNGIEEGPDYNSIGKIADAIYNPYLAEQGMLNQPNITRNADGQYVERVQRDSPQMEWLKKMGLPDPRAQYDVKYALETDPSLMAMLSNVATTQGERDLMRKEFDERMKKVKKLRDEEAGDQRTMDRYGRATTQALNDYFGASSRGQVQRPDMPEPGPWRAPSPRMMEVNAAANRTDPQGMDLARQQAIMNSRIPGMSPGARAELRDLNQPYRPSQAMDYLLGPQRPRPQEVEQPPVNNLPFYMQPGQAGNPQPEPGAAAAGTPQYNMFARPGEVINNYAKGGATDIELALPKKPMLINGIDPSHAVNPEGYSLMESILGKPVKDVLGYANERKATLAIPDTVRYKQQNAKMKKANTAASNAAFQYFMGLAPTVVAGRQGRTPRTDAIQQRLAPLYQMGALGQRM